MHRRWRVRHSYPQPFVEQIRLLLHMRTVREISALLDIPMSVIYRWRALQHASEVASNRRLANSQSESLVLARCRELGFRIASPVDRSNPLPAQLLSGATGNRRTASSGCGADAEPRSSPPTTQPRYSFDASKERSGRRVRQRLEAARRVIDQEYFLEIDSRMLADTAQMSRHHFIRMFSHLLGSTPHQYLIRTRVEAAKRLLIASREPIEVIAAGVGFRSGQSLNRAFKHIEGVSVSSFCSGARKHMPTQATDARQADQADTAANVGTTSVACASS